MDTDLDSTRKRKDKKGEKLMTMTKGDGMASADTMEIGFIRIEDHPNILYFFIIIIMSLDVTKTISRGHLIPKSVGDLFVLCQEHAKKTLSSFHL